MIQKIVIQLVLCVAILWGCQQEPVVLEPQLSISVSSQKLKVGESFTISWKTLNTSFISTSFGSTKDLNGSYSEKLTESKVFWIQAFNSEGLSIVKKVSVTVEPNEFDQLSILLKYKWTIIASDLDLGENEDGSHSWSPRSTTGWKMIFSSDGSYKVLNSNDEVIGTSKDHIWSLDKDKKILTLGSKEYKVLSLTKEKMELYALVTVNYFRDTYRADPKE